MTRWQCHGVDLGGIPSTNDQSTTRWIFSNLANHFGDLIDVSSVQATPIAPLRTVNATEISIFVRPFVPNADAVFVQIFDIGVTTQKPKQLVNDRFEMKLFRRQQGKTLAQIESRLRTKNRQRAGPSAVALLHPLPQNEAKEIMILPHIKRY